MTPITLRVAAAVCCATIFLQPLSVQAATVSQQTGAVLINNGGGFSPMTAPVELAPGSQIMVPRGGLASVTYADNCVVRIGSGIWLVQAAPPCVNGQTELDFTARMNQEGPPAPPLGIPPVVIGVVVVGGAIAAGVLISQAMDKSASP